MLHKLILVSTMCAGVLAAALPGVAMAQPSTPVYSRSQADCVTNDTQQRASDGKQVWTIKAGCDSYQNEVYERPTTQTYEVRNLAAGGQAFAAKEYFQNLDIKQASAGADNTYLYIAIELVGLGHVTDNGTNTIEGLKYEYDFLMSSNATGAGGYLFRIETPGSTWTTKAAKGHRDTNGDVGGLGVSYTKQDDQLDGGTTTEVLGNGFDLMRIDDGTIKNGPNTGAAVLWTRAQGSTVEFALNYGLLGYTRAQIDDIIAGLGFLDFRAIKGGPKDPQNYLWNDEYNRNEAGSPYRCGSTLLACGDLGKSEFGTQGLGNIYELDTLRFGATAVPEPGTWALLILGFGAVGGALRSARKRRPALTYA